MSISKLHRDERGSISIVSVFTVMFLAMLLGMVMNVGRHVDGKLRMQNAADSAAYSGGVVLARGMNTLTFTNHLLCDVFALTAVLREAHYQNSASYASQILQAWSTVAQQFSSSSFPKFKALGSAIQQKIPMEQQMVTAYSAWAKAVSDQVLPTMEEILSDELIPQYQRAVMVAFPEIAQTAAQQTAARNGQPENRRGPMFGVLWRTDAKPVGSDAESSYSPDERTMPVVDPELDTSVANSDQYVQTAVAQRRALSHFYLDQWNNELLWGFDNVAKMCQFSNLWRSFTCGYLEHLLNVEYPQKNLPMQIYEDPAETANSNASLEQHYIYIAVVYWKKLPEMAPTLFTKKLFSNPLEADDQAFAEVHLFIPRDRLQWRLVGGSSGTGTQSPLGGVPGQLAEGTVNGSGGNGTGGGSSPHWEVVRPRNPPPSYPSPWFPSPPLPTWWDPSPLRSPSWSLLNQSWDCQLAPATQSNLPTILQSNPELSGFSSGNYTLPSLGGLSSDDMQQISPH